MTADYLWKTLRRHLGHTLRCVRESNRAAGYTVATMSIRCEDCGEVVLEATDEILGRNPLRRPRPRSPGGA